MDTPSVDLTIPDVIHYARVERSLALPEFQRRYEWDSDDVAEMLRTVIASWPSGSILLMGVRGGDMKFELRPALTGAPDLDKSKVRYAILDGQQRLTSVFRPASDRQQHVLRGHGSRQEDRRVR